MPRPSKKDVMLKDDIERLRKDVIKKFFDIAPKIFEHIQSSMKATKPCVNCSKTDDGRHKPGKAVDELGQCAMCHGSYLVADNFQRNWATEQAQPIVAPSPKTVEMSVENTSPLADLESTASKMSDEDLDAKIKALGFETLVNESEG